MGSVVTTCRAFGRTKQNVNMFNELFNIHLKNRPTAKVKSVAD